MPENRSNILIPGGTPKMRDHPKDNRTYLGHAHPESSRLSRILALVNWHHASNSTPISSAEAISVLAGSHGNQIQQSTFSTNGRTRQNTRNTRTLPKRWRESIRHICHHRFNHRNPIDHPDRYHIQKCCDPLFGVPNSHHRSVSGRRFNNWRGFPHSPRMTMSLMGRSPRKPAGLIFWPRQV